MDQDFETYLREKKIDPDLYRKGDQGQFDEFKTLFHQMHPNSFTSQKLFLINQIRRTYPLALEVKSDTESKTPKAKPRIQPRIKK
ncbi:MAG: hypothetical protein KI790_05865 [Cyclobacteriaceae bacterium]|nr:hypothetical protein [Cyclobacteriaceae bacterium HetDA_MAG_MS6]